MIGSMAAAVPIYKHDPSWQPQIPGLQGLQIYSAVGVLGDEVLISMRGNYSQPIIALDRTGKFLRAFGNETIGYSVDPFGDTWGGHGLEVQHANPNVGRDEDRIWVMDRVKSAVHSFAPNGTLLKSAGHPGYAIDGFGCVADVAFHDGVAYFADGNGIDDNRVEAWAASSGVPERPLWTSERKKVNATSLKHLSGPHSIAWHDASGKLLVADRGGEGGALIHSRIVMMDPAGGRMEKTLACDGLELNPKGNPAPFALRTLSTEEADLLFVATADKNPQDGNPKNQWIYIVDVSKLAVDGSCKTLQRINFPDDHLCETPHLMGLDYKTRDVYLSCIDNSTHESMGSHVVRITPSKEASASVIV